MSGLRGHAGMLLAAGAVTFVAAETQLILSGVTSVSPVVPAGIAAGDLLIACVMRRSAVASDPPAGWSLISTSGPATEGAGTSQWTQVYSRVAAGTEGGSSVTFFQSSSGRMLGQIVALRGSAGTPILEAAVTATQSTASVATIPMPTAFAASVGCLALCVGSFILSQTTVTISASSGWTLRSPAIVNDNRLGIMTRAMDGGDTSGATLTSSITPGPNGTTANVLVFRSGA